MTLATTFWLIVCCDWDCVLILCVCGHGWPTMFLWAQIMYHWIGEFPILDLSAMAILKEGHGQFLESSNNYFPWKCDHAPQTSHACIDVLHTCLVMPTLLCNASLVMHAPAYVKAGKCTWPHLLVPPLPMFRLCDRCQSIISAQPWTLLTNHFTVCIQSPRT